MRTDLGEFSCDLIVRPTDGSRVQAVLVLVSAASAEKDDGTEARKAKEPRVTVAVELAEKTKEAILDGLMKAVLVAEYAWGAEPIKRVHSDREPGLVAAKPELRKQAIYVTLTEGLASNANPVAFSSRITSAPIPTTPIRDRPMSDSPTATMTARPGRSRGLSPNSSNRKAVPGC